MRFSTSRADVRLNQIRRRFIAQGPVSAGKPLRCCPAVTLEKINGQTKDARSSQQAVGLFGLQPTFCLAANEGPPGNADRLTQGAERKLCLSRESVEYAIRETTPDRSGKGQRVRFAKPQEDAGVTMGLPERFPKRLRLRHMAILWAPVGLPSRFVPIRVLAACLEGS